MVRDLSRAPGDEPPNPDFASFATWSGLNNLSGGNCGRDARIFSPKDRRNHLKEQGQKRPEIDQDLADIVATGAKDGEDSITDAAFQRASGKASVRLHVADLGLDGAAPLQELGQ